MTRKKQKPPKVAGFIKKLVEIVKNSQNWDLISYQEQRRCFRIKNVRKFTDIILPKYFKHKNYSSFIRQVNLYSFHKLPNEGKQQIYQQQFFNIESLKDLKKIKRKLMESQIKRNKKKQHNGSSHSDSSYNYHCDSQFQSSQKYSEQQISHIDKQSRESMQNLIEQLQKKKLIIEGKIKQQRETNQRLEYENKQLKHHFQEENLNFYAQTLSILMNLAYSQYQMNQMGERQYQRLMGYLMGQQGQLDSIRTMISQSQVTHERQEDNNNNNKIMESISNLSEFLTSLRFFIGAKNDPNTIPVFLDNLLGYIERQDQQHQIKRQLFEQAEGMKNKQQQNNKNNSEYFGQKCHNDDMSQYNDDMSQQKMNEIDKLSSQQQQQMRKYNGLNGCEKDNKQEYQKEKNNRKKRQNKRFFNIENDDDDEDYMPNYND